MQRFITLLFALLLTEMGSAQAVAGFENFNLPPNTFLNDAGPSGQFSSGNINLPNTYTPAFMSWNGWAISNTTDTLTPGFSNESSAMAGGGAEGSATYAVTYVFGESTLELATPGIVNGFYITNNAYAYYSMQNGDSFAKKFGGATGNDPDFLLLTVKKIYNAQVSTDSVNFYLADYRFADNTQDYIVKDWTWLDLSALGTADNLRFTFSSSDVGAFGINTPTYFCADNITTGNVLAAKTAPAGTLPVEIYPNPTVDFVTVRLSEGNPAATVQIFDLQGIKVTEQTLAARQERFDVRSLPAGVYFLHVWQDGKTGVGKFVKEE